MSRRDDELPPHVCPSKLFAGSGPVRAELRATAWAETLLGDPGGWPTDLICAARTVVAAPTPMLMWWGEQFHQIHNDALTVALDDAAPAVGRPAKDCWPERWELLGPSARLVRTEGEPVQLDEIDLPLRPDATACWTVSMAPLVDDYGQPAGVLAAAADLTTLVAAREAERRRADETALNLQVALASNRRIGTAVGILMAQRRITDDAAFDLLRVTSQRTHRKLRDIAEDVVLTGALPGG